MTAHRRLTSFIGLGGRSAAPALVLWCAAASCAPPRLAPLRGVPTPISLPTADLAPGHQRIVFQWELDDGELRARGDGAARVASPDSVRLDFFVGGGFGSGSAVLVGDTLHAPGPELLRRLIPPIPLLWASLGRLAVPALPDTMVRAEGPVLRANIGRPIAWRITIRHDSLVKVERVRAGRVIEWVVREGGLVRYRNETARRSLRLKVSRSEPMTDFDASIWSLPL